MSEEGIGVAGVEGSFEGTYGFSGTHQKESKSGEQEPRVVIKWSSQVPRIVWNGAIGWERRGERISSRRYQQCRVSRVFHEMDEADARMEDKVV